ncbi:hypothetical protein BHE74_00039137 [Ensete ventricosum]|nr:hypothetical protein BHE74_00039137 [Ensete ventricosum]
MNSGTNPGDLAERVTSDTNPRDLAERVSSGTNLGDLAERVNSSTNPGDLAKRVTLGTNRRDLVERVSSGTNLEDLAERVNSGTNPRDLAERMSSGTNPKDLAERVSSGTNPKDLAERVTSGTNPRDLVERVSSGTNLGDLAERVNSGTNPGDLAERVGMTSSDSSSSVRVISSPGSGGVSLGDPEASPSGASSGPPSPVDARALRDLEVMKVDHDLDTTVTEGSLAAIREWYSIPTEYGLHVSQPGQRPYISDTPDMCVSVDALEADLRFSLHPLIEECLRWWRISPTQLAPNSWRYLVEFLGECRGAGIILTRDLFMAYFHLYKSRGGYYLTAQVGFRVSGAPSNNKDRMDLGNLRGMTKMFRGKAFSAREVDVSPAREALNASSKRLIDAPTEQVDDPAQRSKKVKVLTMLLKEAWVKARKMDDELLQSVKALENARAELPRQVVDCYKESAGFKEGLKRMGRVTYEYGYRVALARFHTLHPDSEVEEDPFTIHPEDDLVPMERQQAFDDSYPPES